MSFLSLDLSSKCTGWAKFSKDGKLLDKGQIVPDKNIDVYFKIHFVTEKVKELFNNVDDLIIEDIFLGTFAGKYNVDTLKYLARLSGAILYAWIVNKYKIPKFYMASTARKLAGINGHSQKAEVQVFILEKYFDISKKELEKYKIEIQNIQTQLKQEEIKKSTFKAKMNKLSDIIQKETNVGEDIADALILGLAYLKEKNEQ